MMHLIARKKGGFAVCPATILKNVKLEERRYPIVEHVVTLDNQPRAVIQHDYLALCTMPDGVYRPMMPSEQNALRLKIMQESTVEE